MTTPQGTAPSPPASPSASPLDSAPDWSALTEEVACPLCSYNLRGLSEPRCPECGFRFAWREVLDPARRAHPYLFEHHPERSVRSFARTVLGVLRPSRFWREMHPAQPTRAWRLALFYLLISLTLFLPALAMQPCRWIPLQRQSWWWQNWDDVGVAAGLEAGPPWVDRLLEKRLSVPFLLGGVGHVPVGRALVALPLLWAGLPWAMCGPLLLFRWSMRRAQVRFAHLVRCVAYPYALAPWVALLLAGAVALTRYDAGRRPGPVLPSDLPPGAILAAAVIAVIPATWVLMSVHLAFAARHYLRFDHAWAVVLTSQAIAALLALPLLWALFEVLGSL